MYLEHRPSAIALSWHVQNLEEIFLPGMWKYKINSNNEWSIFSEVDPCIIYLSNHQIMLLIKQSRLLKTIFSHAHDVCENNSYIISW